MSKEELQVTWEDQKRINEFSVLTSRCENNSTEAAYLAVTFISINWSYDDKGGSRGG